MAAHSLNATSSVAESGEIYIWTFFCCVGCAMHRSKSICMLHKNPKEHGRKISVLREFSKSIRFVSLAIFHIVFIFYIMTLYS